MAAFATTSNQSEDEANDIDRLGEEVIEIEAEKYLVAFTFTFTWFKEQWQGEEEGETCSKTDTNVDCCAYRREGDEPFPSTFSTARL